MRGADCLSVDGCGATNLQLIHLQWRFALGAASQSGRSDALRLVVANSLQLLAKVLSAGLQLRDIDLPAAARSPKSNGANFANHEVTSAHLRAESFDDHLFVPRQRESRALSGGTPACRTSSCRCRLLHFLVSFFLVSNAFRGKRIRVRKKAAMEMPKGETQSGKSLRNKAEQMNLND